MAAVCGVGARGCPGRADGNRRDQVNVLGLGDRADPVRRRKSLWAANSLRMPVAAAIMLDPACPATRRQVT